MYIPLTSIPLLDYFSPSPLSPYTHHFIVIRDSEG